MGKTRSGIGRKAADQGKAVTVSFVLDETGSMNEHKSATISGFNEYVDGLRSRKGLTMSLTKFNSGKVDVVYRDVPIREVLHLNNDTYTPNHMTPLYDAVGQTIRSFDKKSKVLMIIMTDGLENASREYTREHIFNLIRLKERDGWSFVFLGANQDAWVEGERMGMRRDKVSSYTMNDLGRKFSILVDCSRDFMDRGARPEDKFFDKDDEKKLTS